MERVAREVATAARRADALGAMQPISEKLPSEPPGVKFPWRPPEQPQEDAIPDFSGIAVELLRVRQIQSLPLATIEVPRDEVRQRMQRWLATQFPGDYGVREGRALAALGAIPSPVDTTVFRAAFWSHQIGAWLNEQEETVALVEQEDDSNARENALGLAFTQLFREQGARLFSAGEKPSGSDAWQARLGLMAGDASLTRLRHALAHPRSGGGGGVGEDPGDPSREISLPPFLRERDLAAFGVGLDFIGSLHALGGFEQVDAAYGRPPVASIELLEPSLYLAETQFQVESANWSDVTVNGSAPLWDDTFGAIALILFLQQHVPQPLAAECATRWRGDRLLAYAAKSGPRDHAAWQTFWQDKNAADAFFVAMQEALRSRYRGAVEDKSAPRGMLKLDGPDRFVLLTRTNGGRGVFYADAADGSFAKALRVKFVPDFQEK
jgi:hypothetical protein